MGVDQVEEHAGIDGPGAGCHGHAVDGGKAHRGVTAQAMFERAEAGAGAEMGDNGATAGGLGSSVFRAPAI